MQQKAISVMIFLATALATVVVVVARGTTTALPDYKDYCEFETFRASCKSNEVVVMNRAKYGRMNLGRCVVTDLGFVGCGADVLDLADRKCSGKRSCDIRVPDESFASRPRCMNELKSYLEADYSCLPVIAVHDRCTTCEHVQVTQPVGYLASITTQETGCGTPLCPWLIQGQPGQRINITLINFSWIASDTENPSKSCTVYATIKETHAQKSATICASAQREKNVYTSFSNSVTLRIVGKDAGLRTPQQFLFKYEVVACADPLTPVGGWMSRAGDVAVFGCNGSTASSASWKLTCDGHEWQGERRQCSAGSPGKATSMISGGKIPYGLSIAVILTVAVVVGFLILMFGLIIVRRRRNQALQQQSVYQVPPQMVPPYKDPAYLPQNADWHYQEPLDNFDKQLTSGDCSGYTHIWERPLPKPANNKAGGNNSGQNNGSSGTDNEYQKSTTSGDYNTIGSLSNGSRNGNEYGQAYGNNTLARKELDIEDPRYFQLDPDTLPPPPPSLTDK